MSFSLTHNVLGLAKVLKLGFIRRAPNRSTAELALPIAPMSSLTIGNTNVRRIFANE